MRTILCVVTLIAWVSSVVLGQGIKFEKGTWSEIQTKAKKENKFIFVDAYTTWCGPCKYLRKKVFPLKEVGDVYNQHLVSYELDMEKGEGVAFAKKYQVTSYPTLLYFDPQGNLVHIVKGSGGAAKIIDAARQALDPKTQLMAQQRRYKAGARENDFLKRYIKALSLANEPYDKPLSAYLAQQEKANWAKPENWKIIEAYLKRTTSKEFNYILDNRASFAQVLGKKIVSQYLIKSLNEDAMNVPHSEREQALIDYRKKVKMVFPPEEAKEAIARKEYLYYLPDEKKSLKYARKFLDHTNDEIALLYAAWMYTNKYTDLEHLNSALHWINRAIKLKRNVDNLNAKVGLLLKMKRYKQAYPVAQEVVTLAKKEVKSFVQKAQKQLEEIEAKL
ncbi:hypothetical protein BKI52_25165 [marine bacterium AO1-C]|nr:hypothetical protein BKI52_25165 [marine bacterium AO1-C]